MMATAIASPRRETSRENATRVAVIAALSATSMLFASLASAYLVRRSFADWRPAPALWPLALLGFGLWASCAVEVAARARGINRRGGLLSLGLASTFYLCGAIGVILSIVFSEGGMTSPHRAFVVLLLGVHVAHATLAAAFAVSLLHDATDDPSDSRLALARLVTHFLTALLFAIVFLLFVLQ